MKDSLIETTWLEAHRNDLGIRIVDAHWRYDGSVRQLYQRGPLPGAVHLGRHFYPNHTRDDIRNLPLPPQELAEVMAEAGIGTDTRKVTCAETDYCGKARLWWALNDSGSEKVSVVNGGLSRWIAKGQPLSYELPKMRQEEFKPRA